jgi:hypothetical protein
VAAKHPPQLVDGALKIPARVSARERIASGNYNFSAHPVGRQTIEAMVWHYTDTGGAAELRTQGETLPDSLLVHIAPLGWELISFMATTSVRTAQTGVSAGNLRSAFLNAA